MPSNCIFCRIVQSEIKSDILHRTNRLVVLRDISPQAPVHLLVLPVEHIAALSEASAIHQQLLGEMLLTAKRMAAEAGVGAKGYRVAINNGAEGGQSIGHLHMHVLGGRQLSGQLG